MAQGVVLDRPGTVMLDRPTETETEPFTIDDLTRRRFLASVATVALLAACGDDEDDATPTSTPTAAATTRQFTDSTGRSVTVPAHPQRIIALHEWSAAAALFSLGITPIGMVTRDGDFDPGIAEFHDLSSVTKVGNIDAPDLEAITALQPDLIIGLANADSSGPNALFETLQTQFDGIAPTVYLQQIQPVESFMTLFGELVGREDEVAQQRSAWGTRFNSVREQHGDTLDTLSFALVGWFDPTFYIATAAHPFPLLHILTDLGLHLPPVTATAAAENVAWTELSAERIQEAQADVIFWGDNFGDPRQLVGWNTLPAVSAGQLIELTDPFAGNNYDVYNRAMDLLEPLIGGWDPDVVDESTW